MGMQIFHIAFILPIESIYIWVFNANAVKHYRMMECSISISFTVQFAEVRLFLVFVLILDLNQKARINTLLVQPGGQTC